MGHAVGNASKRIWTLSLLSGLIGGIGLMASRGPDAPMAALGAVVFGWTTGGVAGLLWCAGAIGLGHWVVRTTLGTKPENNQPTPTHLANAAALGAGIMLWTAHLTAVLGLYQGTIGIAVAWAPVIIGFLALAGLIRHALAPRSPPFPNTHNPGRVLIRITHMACIPALAVITVAVCVPPGTLWESEARAYDSLSYHLALPKEWFAAGRLAPLEHNAYSWLPSYIEAAYLQLATMLGDAGNDGRWITACAGLHAGLAVLAALCIAALARRVALRAGFDHPATPWIAGTATIAVPWTAVTASLAYNEMGMLLAIAGACLFCDNDHDTPRPWRRGLLLGFSLAIATACKPTAAFMGGPLVLLFILAWNPRHAWPRLLAGAFFAGAAASAPWLIRNAMAGGNPVFPALSSIFGTAHWTPEQVGRWNTAHHTGTGFLNAARRLLSSDGVLHPQWSIFFALALLSAVVVCSSTRARRAAWPLLAGLALQLLAWMTIGHQQPRFLMPCILTGAPIFGVGASVLLLTSWHRAAGAVATAALLVMSLDTARHNWLENDGAPARALGGGCPAITGATLGTDQELAAIPRPELLDALAGTDGAGNPVAATNRLITLDAYERAKTGRPPPLVYLLGDATPLYFDIPVLWNTTWDNWPLESARATDPDHPRAWADDLRRRGVTHVLVNLAEIDRLRLSGYSPPGMTVDAAARFVREACAPVIEWPRMGTGLFELTQPQGPDIR